MKTLGTLTVPPFGVWIPLRCWGSSSTIFSHQGKFYDCSQRNHKLSSNLKWHFKWHLLWVKHAVARATPRLISFRVFNLNFLTAIPDWSHDSPPHPGTACAWFELHSGLTKKFNSRLPECNNLSDLLVMFLVLLTFIWFFLIYMLGILKTFQSMELVCVWLFASWTASCLTPKKNHFE